MDAKDFGHYLWTLRVGKMLALNHVANKIEISCRDLGDIEHGRLMPTVEVLRKLENVYQMNQGALDIFMPVSS